MKVITVYSLVEQYKINATLARFMMKSLHEAGTIKCINASTKMPIYTKA